MLTMVVVRCTIGLGNTSTHLRGGEKHEYEVNISKKGDKAGTGNYKGISLIRTVGKNVL